MRRAAAFMLLFLLALGALGGASAYLTRDACDLRGELLLGDRAGAAGVAGISGGRRTVRAETAAVAFTAVTMFLLGELG